MAASFPPSTFFDSPSGYIPRPYPPPCLEGVPRIFQIEYLRGLAGDLFNDPSQSDCFLVIPYDDDSAARIAQDPTVSERSTHDCFDKASTRRRPLAYTHLGALGMMHLHVDYLSPFSRLFRALFTGATPREIFGKSFQSSPSADDDMKSKIIGSSDTAALEGYLPQLFAGAGGRHATVYLPLPDPPSFHYIIHWMYFGEPDLIVKALSAGQITWQGLINNGSFLGMSEEWGRLLAEVRFIFRLRYCGKRGEWSGSDDTDEEPCEADMSDPGLVDDDDDDDDDAQADDEDEEDSDLDKHRGRPRYSIRRTAA